MYHVCTTKHQMCLQYGLRWPILLRPCLSELKNMTILVFIVCQHAYGNMWWGEVCF